MTKKQPAKNDIAKKSPAAPGEYAYDGLDRVIHEKARLGILTSLMNAPNGLVFGDLRTLCSLTDGNLNRHLQALHEANLVEIWKGQREKYPQTLVRLTKHGRQRFMEYIQELERVIAQAVTSKANAVKSADAKPAVIRGVQAKTT